MTAKISSFFFTYPSHGLPESVSDLAVSCAVQNDWFGIGRVASYHLLVENPSESYIQVVSCRTETVSGLYFSIK
jgi:hypothetical protein